MYRYVPAVSTRLRSRKNAARYGVTRPLPFRYALCPRYPRVLSTPAHSFAALPRENVIRVVAEAAVLDRFQNMNRVDGVFSLKVGYGAGDFEDAVASPP